MRLDALPPLTEAAELLGFATVAQGDLTLTPLGETFADAGILARREIFASRIRRVPIFRWLLGLLTAADSHQLGTEVVTAALELDFPTEEERAGRSCCRTTIPPGPFRSKVASPQSLPRQRESAEGPFPIGAVCPAIPRLSTAKRLASMLHRPSRSH